MSPKIHWLDSSVPLDTPLVGGKTAPLGAPAALGLPVPAGFVVDASAYAALVASSPALGLAAAKSGVHMPGVVAQTLLPMFNGLALPGSLSPLAQTLLQGFDSPACRRACR